MAETADAETELDRRGRELHASIAELVALCTPEALSALAPLRAPRVADWHEPLRYRHSITLRGSRDPAIPPATLADRADAAMTAAGWQVSRDPDPGRGDAARGVTDTGPSGLVVSGQRAGDAVRVRFSVTSPVVLYTGETAAFPRAVPDVRADPQPVRTADGVDSGHVLCYECSGAGWCPVCHGRGWVSDPERGRARCPECFDGRLCPICAGAGQLALALLSPAQRAHYVHLPDGSM